MTTLQDRFAQIFPAPRRRGLVTEIANLCGVNKASVSQWFNQPDKVSTINRTNAERICAHFRLDVSPTWLAEGTLPKTASLSNVIPITSGAPQTYPASDKNRKPIWVVGKASGGMPERLWTDNDFPVGDLYEYAEEASSDPSAFLVEIDNTSMLERYAPGEFALVEPHTPVQPGDDVLVRLATGHTLVKRLDMIQNGYRLRSLNGGEQLFFAPQEVSWVYYVAHPVPRRRIKSRC